MRLLEFLITRKMQRNFRICTKCINGITLANELLLFGSNLLVSEKSNFFCNSDAFI